jgi:hypothetical protein
VTDRILYACRICGIPTEGHGLEGLHDFVAVQAWCPEHCMREFEEHDFLLEDEMRYCKRCGTEEDPDATFEYLRDLSADWGDDYA